MIIEHYWVDAVIVTAIIYFIYEGWERGFVSLIAHFSSFLVSLWLAVRFHAPVGVFIIEKLGISSSWANVLGYIVIAFGSQILLEEIFLVFTNSIPEKLRISKMNHLLGGALSLLNGLVILSFFLLLILSLPLKGSIQSDIRNSKLGSSLVYISERYGGSVRSSLEDAAQEAIKFLTVNPNSRENIPLEIPVERLLLTEDSLSEHELVVRVNSERTRRGLTELSIDASITSVARGKSRDMFERGYFSHFDPDGKNVADRMNGEGVAFTFVGENLAYAPDVLSAHTGLMESEGHRANILEPRFKRIGIGIIDGGIYGKMFTQIFAD